MMHSHWLQDFFGAAGKDTLSQLLAERFASAPDSVAFVDGASPVTTVEFATLCAQAAAWLRHEGIGAGDRVAVWMVNRVEWLALYFGLSRIGAILVSVNTRYRSEEVTHILAQSGAKMLVLQPGFRRIDFAAVLAGVDAARLPTLRKIAVCRTGDVVGRLLDRDTVPLQLAGMDVQFEAGPVDADAPSILFTTSGTTKGPKMVAHSQRTISGHARHCAKAIGLDQPAAAMLAMLPLCGVFGLNGALAAFAGQAPVILVDSFQEDAVAKLLNDHQITHTFGSDDMYKRIIDRLPGDRPLPHARLFGFGAFTSAFNDYALACWQRGIPLTGLYGSSEVLACWSAQSTAFPVEQRVEGGGVPVAGAAAGVRIRDNDSLCLLPAGQLGEIEIRGPSNFIGYFQNPDATAEALTDDGFFRTGDLGYLREDGSLVYQARMGDAVRLGGFLVNPMEIEEVLKQFPGVQDAQVVAVQIDGQLRPVAFVIAVEAGTFHMEDLLAQSRERMAAFKVPARVWLVDTYPVTQSANGVKTQRNKLREWALERLQGEPDRTGKAVSRI